MRRDDLDEYARLEAERKTLDRQSKTLKDRCEQLAALFRTELESKGKTNHKAFGYTVSLVDGTASVSWSKEYLAAMGPAKVDELKAAAALNAPKRLVVTIPTNE